MEKLDVDDYDAIAKTFNVAAPLVQEIEWMNDEAGVYRESTEARWSRMRVWVLNQIKAGPAPAVS